MCSGLVCVLDGYLAELGQSFIDLMRLCVRTQVVRQDVSGFDLALALIPCWLFNCVSCLGTIAVMVDERKVLPGAMW